MSTSEILLILALVCTLVAAFTRASGPIPYAHAGWLGVSLWIFSILIAR